MSSLCMWNFVEHALTSWSAQSSHCIRSSACGPDSEQRELCGNVQHTQKDVLHNCILPDPSLVLYMHERWGLFKNILFHWGYSFHFCQRGGRQHNCFFLVHLHYSSKNPRHFLLLSITNKIAWFLLELRKLNTTAKWCALFEVLLSPKLLWSYIWKWKRRSFMKLCIWASLSNFPLLYCQEARANEVSHFETESLISFKKWALWQMLSQFYSCMWVMFI